MFRQFRHQPAERNEKDEHLGRMDDGAADSLVGV
jgi:hypothetical protein